MRDNITYSDCLSSILIALDLKSSQLAREINIDSSLIYKWIRDERVPPYESPYIDLILNQIAKRLINSSRRDAITNVLHSYGIELSETSDTHILNKLRLILETSQGYSIKLRKNRKAQQKLYSSRISRVADFIENIDTQKSESPHYSNSTEKRNFDDFINNENPFSGRDHMQIVHGDLKVLYAYIKLLKQAQKPRSSSDTILMTINGDLNLLTGAKDLNSYLIQVLYDLLSNGWNIMLLLKLDSDINRTIKIIEDLQVLLAVGNLKLYYYKNSFDTYNNTELCIVPNVGALFSFSTAVRDKIDSAFLYHSKQSIEMLTARFYQDLESAKPLLKFYPPQYSAEIQKAFAECEETQGEKYVFKEGLSTITMPLRLFEKYNNLSGETEQEISYRNFLHKRKIDAFEMQIPYFKYKDICFIEALEELVHKRRYSGDGNYIQKKSLPGYEDIICHLEHLIFLLKKYNNYEIAFVNYSQLKPTSNINWMVKSKDSVLIEAYRKNLSDSDVSSTKMNFVITEKSVVKAFHDYFLILWESIPEENKNKKKTIALLRRLIKECERRGAELLFTQIIE